MATTRLFQDMLNEYLPNSLLSDRLVKMDYILNRVNKDNNWKQGTIIVPFKGTKASSLKFGGLTDADDISSMKPVRGEISSYKEVWGSMIFYHTDLMQHDGKIKESTFIRVLGDTVEDFTQHFKEAVSIQLGCGPHFAAVSDATDAATGIMIVDRIERFCIDQKVSLDDDDTALASYYITGVNLNTSAITLSATRGGGAANVSAYSVAQNAVFYQDGITGVSDNFTSLKSALLSLANGGSTNLYGQAKTAYPYLQAINIDGSTISASNIIENIFNAWVEVRRKGRGTADEVLMSWQHLGSVLKAVEVQKGSYKVREGSMKATEFGWTTIEILNIGTGSMIKFIGIQEFDDDIIVFADWSKATFRSNGMIQKRTAPDGKQYYETRTTSGYAYILDMALFGELEIRNPSCWGIIHTISY